MKPFYMSKTLWANVIMLGLVVAKFYGVDVPAPDPALVAVINLTLRLVTNSAIKGMGR